MIEFLATVIVSAIIVILSIAFGYALGITRNRRDE